MIQCKNGTTIEIAWTVTPSLILVLCKGWYLAYTHSLCCSWCSLLSTPFERSAQHSTAQQFTIQHSNHIHRGMSDHVPEGIPRPISTPDTEQSTAPGKAGHSMAKHGKAWHSMARTHTGCCAWKHPRASSSASLGAQSSCEPRWQTVPWCGGWGPARPPSWPDAPCSHASGTVHPLHQGTCIRHD